MASMMAAGISSWRIVKPLIISVAIVAGLGVLNRELLLPHLGSSISRDARNFAGDQVEEFRSQYDHATGVFFDGEGVIPASSVIDRPSLHLPSEMADRGTSIQGAQAQRKPATKDHPAGFLVSAVVQNDLSVQRSLKLDDQIIVYHPDDFNWLQADQLFVVTDLPFQQWRRSQTPTADIVWPNDGGESDEA